MKTQINHQICMYAYIYTTRYIHNVRAADAQRTRDGRNRFWRRSEREHDVCPTVGLHLL